MVAHADQFVYAGSSLEPGNIYNFTYISDHRIVTTESFTPLTCMAQGQTCNTGTIEPKVPNAEFSEASVSVGTFQSGGGTSELDPRFFLTGQGYEQIYGSRVALLPIPDSVQYLYDFYSGDFNYFTLYAPALITSRSTFNDADGGTFTIDPVRGEIFGSGDYALDGLNLTGLPPSFLQPGFNQFALPDTAPYDYPSLLVVGRGGSETVTPEPSSLLLLGSGVGGLAMLVRRRRS